MAPETDSYDDYVDAVYENDEATVSDEAKVTTKTREPKSVKNNMATWRKIEDFWDNYRLNKQINDDPLKGNYSDYLLDG